MDLDTLADAKIISEFSAMLSALKNANTLKILKLMLDGQLEVLSNSTSSDVDSVEYQPTIKIPISATPQRSKVKTLAAGTLLNLNSTTDSEVSIGSPSPILPSPYLKVVRDLVVDDNLADAVSREAFKMASKWQGSSRVRYSWLNFEDVPYTFGRTTHAAKDLRVYPNIMDLMSVIDNHMGNPGLDSCLVTYYDNGHIELPLHSDNEYIIDQSCPIVIFSLGLPRTIRFCKKPDREHIASFQLGDCAILVMKPGYQQELEHSVIESSENSTSQRISLSFRKLAKQRPPVLRAPSISPILPSKPSPMHYSHPPRPITEGYQEPGPVVSTYPPPPPQPSSSSPHQQPPGSVPYYSNNNINCTFPKHLVIGDSLIRRIVLPNSVTICRGGGKPRDIIPYLLENEHILPRKNYKYIQSITLSCGTNAISNTHLNLDTIISDYDELLDSLCSLFPNAHIALFNIPPRSYKSPIIIQRIYEFNNYLFHIARECSHYISFINLFREFLSPHGYLKWNLYRGDLLHFSHLGNMLLSHRIADFQKYNDRFPP